MEEGGWHIYFRFLFYFQLCLQGRKRRGPLPTVKPHQCLGLGVGVLIQESTLLESLIELGLAKGYCLGGIQTREVSTRLSY